MTSIDIVQNISPRIQYSAGGGQTVFPYPFPIFANTDLVVYDESTLQIITTDYNVSGAGDDNGGNVTFTSGRTAGHVITIYRDVAIERLTDFQQNGPNMSASMNDELDRITIVEQQLENKIDRTIKLSPLDTSLDDDGTLPLAASRAGKFFAWDAQGKPSMSAGTGNDSALRTDLANTVAGADGSRLIGFKRTEAGAVARSLFAAIFRSAYTDDFGVVSDGVTDDTAAWQAAFTACAGKVTLRHPRGSSFSKLTSRVTAPANLHLVLEDGAEMRWTATTSSGTALLGVTTRPGIEVTGDNFRLEGRGLVTGPSVASYVAMEIGIFAKGTSTSVRKSGFVIAGNIEFSNWGYAGWVCQFVDNINASGFYAHDIGHAGWFTFSCTHGLVHHFRCKNMTPGDGSSQAFGFSVLHDSTNYSTDPNIATPRLVANPFCIDIKVHDFTIEDVPTWEGADIHGGYEVEFFNFAIYNCRHGVVFGAGSGGAVNYAGENNKVHHGHCTTKKADGSATSVSATDRNGLVLKGGSVVQNMAVQADHMTLDGFGDTGNTSFSIYAQYVRQAQISNITVTNWKGEAIYSADGDGIISSCIFEGAASATNARCINIDTTTGTWTIAHNKHRPITGTAAAEGLRYQSGNPRLTLIGNDFDYATTPYIFPAGEIGLQTRGASDITPCVSATGTPTSVSVAAAGRAPIVRVIFNTSGPSTVADFTGAQPGQVLQCEFPTTNVTTVDRTNSALAGGANFVSTQYDILMLRCVNTAGVKFNEISRSANS